MSENALKGKKRGLLLAVHVLVLIYTLNNILYLPYLSFGAPSSSTCSSLYCSTAEAAHYKQKMSLFDRVYIILQTFTLLCNEHKYIFI